MKFSFRYQLIFFCLLVPIPFFFIIQAGQNPTGVNQKSLYLAEADSLIRIEDYDEALISYFMAYDLGLPRDSLFFLWAELYVKKGDLDSALAVNQSAMEMCNAALRKDLLKQRYSIYVFLGAEEAALKISKEIGETGHKIKPKITPYLNTGLYLRLEPENVHFTDSSYWVFSGSRDDYMANEVFGIYRLSANLRFENHPGWIPDFSTGALFQVRKNTDISSISGSAAFDSLSIESGVYFRLDNLADRLGIELRSVYNSDSYNAKRWVHSLVYSLMATETFFSIGGYNFAIRESKQYDYQHGFVSMMKDFRCKKFTFSPSLNLSGFFTKHESLTDTLTWLNIGKPIHSCMVYFDGAELQMDSLPLFYSDVEKRNPLDSSGINSKNNFFPVKDYAERIKKSSSALETVLDLPMSHFRIEPAFVTTFPLKRKWSIKSGIRLGIEIYTQLYRWHEFYNNEIPLFLAMDIHDNSYYQINGMSDTIPSVEPREFGIGKKIGNFISQRRLDTDLQGSVSVGHTFKRAGNIIFSLQLNKSWTNLPADCPVEISDWSVAFITDWQCSINFRKKR